MIGFCALKPPPIALCHFPRLGTWSYASRGNGKESVTRGLCIHLTQTLLDSRYGTIYSKISSSTEDVVPGHTLLAYTQKSPNKRRRQKPPFFDDIDRPTSHLPQRHANEHCLVALRRLPLVPVTIHDKDTRLTAVIILDHPERCVALNGGGSQPRRVGHTPQCLDISFAYVAGGRETQLRWDV